MKIVITGGPGSGKSTVIRELVKFGHTALTESARELIIQEQEKGGSRLPWKDWKSFQLALLNMQLEREGGIRGQIFLDRGVIDGVAYCRLHKAQPPKELLKACARNSYKIIFLLETLPKYEADHARKEDPETARKLATLIEKVYKEHGHEPIKVPVLPPAERAKFILKKTREVIQ